MACLCCPRTRARIATPAPDPSTLVSMSSQRDCPPPPQLTTPPARLSSQQPCPFSFSSDHTQRSFERLISDELWLWPAVIRDGGRRQEGLIRPVLQTTLVRRLDCPRRGRPRYHPWEAWTMVTKMSDYFGPRPVPGQSHPADQAPHLRARGRVSLPCAVVISFRSPVVIADVSSACVWSSPTSLSNLAPAPLWS